MDFYTKVEGKRMVYGFLERNLQDNFWDSHWRYFDRQSLERLYQFYLKGNLGQGVLAHVLKRYLPQKGLILEGGCGLGQYVAALRVRGYDCIGVDSAHETVAKVKELFPDFPISSGDITKLDMEDNILAGYISLGVAEHFQEGPEPVLKEAWRLLKSNGYLIISVPQFIRDRERDGLSWQDSAVFYQYAFKAEEFREILESCGFFVRAEYGYESSFGLKLKSDLIKSLIMGCPPLKRIDLLLDRTPLWRVLARMMIFVAQKRQRDA